MYSNNDILQQLRAKASELRQKASSSNRDIRRELRRLSKPGPDRLSAEQSRALTTLSKVLGRRGKDRIEKEAEELVKRKDEAEEELSSVEEQINALILAAYDSIMTDASIPEDFFDVLSHLFGRWNELQLVIKDSNLRLMEMVDELENADAVYEESPELFERNERASRPLSSSFDVEYLRQLDVDTLISMRHLLRGMATLRIIEIGTSMGIKPCCARYVAEKATRTPTVFSEKHHDRKNVKILRNLISRTLGPSKKGRSGSGEARSLRMAMKLLDMVMHALPSDMIEAERKYAQQALSLIKKAGGNMPRTTAADYTGHWNPAVHIRHSVILNFFAEFRELSRLQVHKRFFLETGIKGLKKLRFSDPKDLETAFQDKHNLGRLAILAGLLENSFYSQHEVTDMLYRFGLPEELLDLVSSMNFIFEHPTVVEARSSEEHKRSAINGGYFTISSLANFLDHVAADLVLLPDFYYSPLKIVLDVNKVPVLVLQKDGINVVADRVDDFLVVNPSPNKRYAHF